MRTFFDPRALFYLHNINQAGSMSAASELLTVSQPTLSRAVSSLEAQTGRQLMIRGRNGVILTEAGLLLAEQGRQISEDLRGASDIVDRLKKESPPTVRLGAGPLIAYAAVDDFVAGEMVSHKDKSFHYIVGTARQLITDLLHGRLDIAILTAPPKLYIEHLQCVNIIEENISLFTGNSSPLLASNSRVDKQILSKARWVTIEATYGPQSSFDSMIRHFDLSRVSPAVNYNMNIQGMFKALQQTNALCFLPARITSVLSEKENVSEIDLGFTSDSRQISIWHAADADLNQDLADLIRRAKFFLNNRLSS